MDYDMIEHGDYPKSNQSDDIEVLGSQLVN